MYILIATWWISCITQVILLHSAILQFGGPFLFHFWESGLMEMIVSAMEPFHGFGDKVSLT